MKKEQLSDRNKENIERLEGWVAEANDVGYHWFARTHNSRWILRILCYYRFANDTEDKPKRVMTIHWNKQLKGEVLTKAQRQVIVKKMRDLGLVKKLTQESIGLMLSVSTGTISKDLEALSKSMPSTKKDGEPDDAGNQH